jgi:site-specific DNA recombinase
MEIVNTDAEQKRKVAIYIRVSTSEQKVDGYSLEAQRKKLKEHIFNNEALNFTTKEEWIFEDVHTGSELKRKGLQKMLEMVKAKKFDAVLVWKIDRLSRNLQHLLAVFKQLEENDVSFISVQENIDFKGPMGKLIFQIFGAIAQFERELIKGRTHSGIVMSAEMGNYTGSAIPYGYRPVKNPSGRGRKLQIVPEEKKWVQEIFNWYIFDQLGLGQITDKLNKLKVPISKYNKGQKWSERTARTMIHNNIYRGQYVANRKDDNGNLLPEDKWTIVSIPPCISELTFQQAQAVCKARKGNKTHTSYLLSGKLRDMTIDRRQAFVGKKRSKGGFSYARKQFRDDDGYYPIFEIPAKPIEDYVWKKVTEALSEPEVFINHYLSKEYGDATKIERLETELNLLREREQNIKLGIARIEEAFENGSYSEEKMSKKSMAKEGELAKVMEDIQTIEDELGFIGAVDAEVKSLREASAQVKYRLDKLNQKQKKILIDLFVEKVEMYRHRENDKEKWEIEAEVYFRFDPNKFPNDLTGGRTGTSLKTKGNIKNKLSKIVNGATYRSRTDDPLFTRQLLYQLS